MLVSQRMADEILSSPSESVECGAGAQIDEAEQADDDRGADKAVERQLVYSIDLLPDGGEGQATVPGECPDGSKCDGERANRGEHADAQDEEEETEATTCRARGARQSDGNRLTSCSVKDSDEEDNIFSLRTPLSLRKKPLTRIDQRERQRTWGSQTKTQ